jgi:DNA polymerase III delta prime subunit
MEKLNIDEILDRETQKHMIINIMKDFELNKNNLLFKRGIYIYGDPGTGKTLFITNILKELNYDIIKYDAGDIRNTTVIDDITKHNMSDRNVMGLFNKKVKKIAIIMDEIDGMNNGDKGGITALIKLIRPKKTKKQKLEEITMNPVICIGNYHVDKKIKELMKVCNTIELKTPSQHQMSTIIQHLLPNIQFNIKEKTIQYVQGDLRKLNSIYNLYKNNSDCFTCELLDSIFQIKSYNDDTTKITNKLIDKYHSLYEHIIINDTDRASVGLLWHENIIDVIQKYDKKVSIPFYLSQLENICFADYIDRIRFQKQIWQFNEMGSLIKTFKNNKHYHETLGKNNKYSINEIRFTKVLTKYSTEYNNSGFIQKLCQNLGMDKKDLIGFFNELKNRKEDNEIIMLLDNYNINEADIKRIYTYIDKYIKENATGMKDKEIDEDDSVEISE